MKAILEFNLPEERAEHAEALFGGRAVSILSRIRQELRRLRKYSQIGDEALKVVCELEEFFYDQLEGLPEEVEL